MEEKSVVQKRIMNYASELFVEEKITLRDFVNYAYLNKYDFDSPTFEHLTKRDVLKDIEFTRSYFNLYVVSKEEAADLGIIEEL